MLSALSTVIKQLASAFVLNKLSMLRLFMFNAHILAKLKVEAIQENKNKTSIVHRNCDSAL